MLEVHERSYSKHDLYYLFGILRKHWASRSTGCEAAVEGLIVKGYAVVIVGAAHEAASWRNLASHLHGQDRTQRTLHFIENLTHGRPMLREIVRCRYCKTPKVNLRSYAGSGQQVALVGDELG
jgi:hypothetical protein